MTRRRLDHSFSGRHKERAGEVIFLSKGTKVAYEAAEDDPEVVYVTYPHWIRRSAHAALLDSYHPVFAEILKGEPP